MTTKADEAEITKRLLDPATELLLKQPFEGNVQKEDTCKTGHKPRLLTVSYSCAVIILTWFVFGLTIGYTSPVLNDLEENGNSSAPLDKTSYQDLFSVCNSVANTVKSILMVSYCIQHSSAMWHSKYSTIIILPYRTAGRAAGVARCSYCRVTVSRDTLPWRAIIATCIECVVVGSVQLSIEF